MPSDEKNLDSLLKEMSEEKESGSPAGAEASMLDVDALSEMTEDEIAEMLFQQAEKPEKKQEAEDVLELLEGAGEKDLQEIHSLLKKSDQNETIDGDWQDAGAGKAGDDSINKLLADIEGAGEEKVAEKATDKKAQRALLREQKKREKAARKAAKQAARAGSKKGGGAVQETENADLFDMQTLDDIVSGADQLKQTEGREMSAAEAERKIPELLEQDIVAVDMDQVEDLIPDISERRGDAGKKSKQGFMAKALSFLMEEEEEEEESASENEDILLSDENQEILKALEGKDSNASKPSKGKKNTKKNTKKKDAKAKKAKPKKPKPKKVKKPKEEEPYIPGRRLTFKKMLPVLLLGVSFGAAILIVANLSVDYMDKRAAVSAYEEKNYEACYLNLFNKDRDEEQERMYVASESILYMRLLKEEYESFAERGSEVEALDSLIQTVNGYPALNAYASQWEAVAEVYDLYGDMLVILEDKYGISEAQALEIAAVRSDVEYTRIVTALAEGRSYGSWGRPVVVEPEAAPDEGREQLPDELPEEAELDEGEFVDNQ